MSTPFTDPVIVYGPPIVPFAVMVGDVAIPEAFVVAEIVVLPAKAALAPKMGAENVTVIPLTGFPPASLTVATSGLAKAVPTGALCPPPLVAVTDAGAPALLVSEKLVGVETPFTAAVIE